MTNKLDTRTDQRVGRTFTMGTADWPTAKGELEDHYAPVGSRRRKIINEFAIAYEFIESDGPVTNRDIEAHVREVIMRKRNQNPKGKWRPYDPGIYNELEALTGVEVS